MKLTLHLALRSRVAKSRPLASPAKARMKTAPKRGWRRRDLIKTGGNVSGNRGVMLAAADPAATGPIAANPASAPPQPALQPASTPTRPGQTRQTETGRPMPPGLAVLLVQSQPGLPVSAPPDGLPAGRRTRPLASQRPGGRGAGPGDLGTAGRRVDCCSPACRGRRSGRGPELGIGISKPAPAMRAATAAAPASPIGQMW